MNLLKQLKQLSEHYRKNWSKKRPVDRFEEDFREYRRGKQNKKGSKYA